MSSVGDADSLTEAPTEEEIIFFRDIRNLINILHTQSQGDTESAIAVRNILTQNGFPIDVWDRRIGTWADFAFGNPVWDNEQIWIDIYEEGSDELKRLLRKDPCFRLIKTLVGHDPFSIFPPPPEVSRIETPPQTPPQTPRQGVETPSSVTNSIGRGAPSSNGSFGSDSPDSLPRPPPTSEFLVMPPPPGSPYRGGRKIKTKKQRKSKSKKYRKKVTRNSRNRKYILYR